MVSPGVFPGRLNDMESRGSTWCRRADRRPGAEPRGEVCLVRHVHVPFTTIFIKGLFLERICEEAVQSYSV